MKFGKELLGPVSVFVLGLISIVFFWNSPLVLAAILLALYLALNRYQRRNDLAMFLLGAILGPIAEVLAIRNGAWQYSMPNFLGIPIWLPFGWGLAVVLIARISESLFGAKEKQSPQNFY